LTVYYVDTSALVKRYVNENGSAWVESIVSVASGNDVYVVRLTELELTPAIVRRTRGGSLNPTNAASILTQFNRDCANEYQFLEVVPNLFASGLLLIQKYGLRASDSLQLAAILMLNEERGVSSLPKAIMVSADGELNAAAFAEGLVVEDPNLYP
jgi:hypothetical protein